MPSSHAILRAAAALACIAGAALSAACSGQRTLAEERMHRAERGSGDLLIGAPWPWERHKWALYGEGMQLAIDEVNAAGGVHARRLRIVREDDQENVDSGRIVAQRLTSDPDIVAVIGHLQSYVSIPAAAIYDLSGVVMVAPSSTDPALTRLSYRHVFRAIVTDREIGRAMAEHAAVQGYRRVAIYYIRNQYGRSLANAFEERGAELGVAIVDRQSYDQSSTTQIADRTVGELLDGWSQRQLDALFLAGEAPQAARVIVEARRRGLTIPVLGGDALGTPELVAAGGRAVDGTVFAAPFHPNEQRAGVQRFVSAFRTRYGTAPDVAAALGYDAVHLLARAMTAADVPAGERLAAALRATTGWQGVTGEFTFNDEGDLVGRSIVKVVVRNGAFEWLDTPALTARR